MIHKRIRVLIELFGWIFPKDPGDVRNSLMTKRAIWQFSEVSTSHSQSVGHGGKFSQLLLSEAKP